MAEYNGINYYNHYNNGYNNYNYCPYPPATQTSAAQIHPQQMNLNHDYNQHPNLYRNGNPGFVYPPYQNYNTPNQNYSNNLSQHQNTPSQSYCNTYSNSFQHQTNMMPNSYQPDKNPNPYYYSYNSNVHNGYSYYEKPQQQQRQHVHHNHSGHNHSGHNHSGHNHSGHNHSGHNHSGHNHNPPTVPPQQQPVSANSDFDAQEEFADKLISFARFNRNNESMKTIMSDVVVPDVSSYVTTNRLKVLTDQVYALTTHQKKVALEIEEIDKEFKIKKQELKDRAENFQEEYKKLCKPAVGSEEFEDMVNKSYDALKRNLELLKWQKTLAWAHETAAASGTITTAKSDPLLAEILAASPLN